MKKLRIFLVALAFLLIFGVCSYAAIDSTIHFDISYTGEVKVNEEKDTNIILAGQSTPTHTNVRVKVEIEGPATPKLMATDSLGTTIDIAQWGYWGPEAGFAISGTFTNETPVKATFTKAGAYTIKLTLLDVQNANDILAQKTVTIQVKEDEPAVNEITNVMENEEVKELPKTGATLGEYAIYFSVICIGLYLVYLRVYRRK